MSRKTFISFAALVVVLAVVIPWLVFRSDGESAEGAEVPASLASGKFLFQTNCGTCHTLYAAGTDGNFAPNLDELLAPNGPPEGETAKQTIKGTEERVLNAIHNGIDNPTTPGRMPAGIISGLQAEEVAEFVANTAGQG